MALMSGPAVQSVELLSQVSPWMSLHHFEQFSNSGALRTGCLLACDRALLKPGCYGGCWEKEGQVKDLGHPEKGELAPEGDTSSILLGCI